jgi:hypothetical protein
LFRLKSLPLVQMQGELLAQQVQQQRAQQQRVLREQAHLK